VEWVARTEEKIRGLIEFITSGDRSEYVVATLRDLEAFARSEKAELADLAAQANRPLRLPSIEEVTALATDLGARLGDDVEIGREMLRRWLHEGTIRIDPSDEGPVATTSLLPMRVLLDSSGRSRRDHGGRKDGRKRKITEGSALSDLQLLTHRSGGRICCLNNPELLRIQLSGSPKSR
jgi:hypothetical protein